MPAPRCCWSVLSGIRSGPARPGLRVPLVFYATCFISCELAKRLSSSDLDRHYRPLAIILLAFGLSWRFFRSRGDQGFLSFIALVSVTGLALGVAILVVVLSLMNGFERELRERVLGVLPHALLTPRSPDLDIQDVMAVAMQHPEVTGLAPLVSGFGLALAGQTVQGVTIAGVEPAMESEVSILPGFMLEGDFGALHEPYTLLLGQRLARELGVGMGDKVTLVAPSAQVSLLGVRPRMKRFTLAGIFQAGTDVDLNQVFVHRRDALRLLRASGEDGVRLQLQDLFRAHLVLQDLVAEIGLDRIGGRSWMVQFGSLYEAIRIQKAVLWLLLLLIVLVAVFNLVSTLMLVVGERRGEIAVLRSMGASVRTIVLTFIFSGLLTGVTGTCLGLASGVLITLLLEPCYQAFASLTGWSLMNEYFIDYLPSQLLFDDLWKIALTSVLLCFLATIYPAWRVANLQPVQLLCHE